MYKFYLKQGEKQVLLPVTPSEIKTKTGNANKTVSVLNMGQVNLLKHPGLREVSFSLLLPGRTWSFVQTENGFREPAYFLELFQEWKAAKKPMSLIIFRRLADGSQLFSGNMELSLEEYTVTEKGGEQGDFWVDTHWKEYRPFQSIRYDMKKGSQGTELVEKGAQRTAKESPKTYTVQKGDTLWAIAKGQLGDGSKFQELATKNKVQNPNKIYVGQILKLD